MVQEIFILEVKPGTEEAFEQSFNKAKKMMETSKGYKGAELKRCIEQNNKYLVSVSWSTVEAHVEDFKNSEEFEEMKGILLPFYQSPPTVQHYRKVN